MKNSTFLAGFPTQLFGSKKGTIQEIFQKQKKSLAAASLSDFAILFQSLIPPEFLNSIADDKRKRIYPEIVVFWAWLAQVLLANASCSKAVKLVRSWCSAHELPVPSTDTSAYCQARKRLRLSFLMQIFERITTITHRRIRPQDRWKGLVVKSIDGSSVQLMDSKDNQDTYPQPSTQKKGCGFPVMGISAVLNHASGCWEAYVTTKHTEHDHKVAHQLLDCFGEGDLFLADTAYSSYELTWRVKSQGADTLMPLHQARKADFRRGKKIGPNERLYLIEKPKKQPKGSALSADGWEEIGDGMEVRIIRFWYTDRDGKQKRKHLVTTLLDTEQYPWQDLVALYLERWDIELRFRDVKTTMKFESIEVKSPEMAHKSLAMALIGFNLLKAVSQEAIKGHQSIREVSFKGVLDEIVSFSSNFRHQIGRPHKTRDLYAQLLELVSQQTVDVRPNRREPRAIKKRPKPFPRLQQPRKEWKEAQAA